MLAQSYVYHYTPVTNVARILSEGLIAKSSFSALRSALRAGTGSDFEETGVVYAWMNPQHDKMGYNGNPDYCCLKIAVDPNRCYVASMDIASAAFVNYKGFGKPQDLDLARRLTEYYDTSATNLSKYTGGKFRLPEVLVPGSVSPDRIELLTNVDEDKNMHHDNEHLYYQRIRRELDKLCRLDRPGMELPAVAQHLADTGLCTRVAVHDDNGGLIATYYIEELTEFITVPFGGAV